MNDTVTIDAGWALWGKSPGSVEDYSVLASSSALIKENLARILTYFAPGTPPAETGIPGSLPWVTISNFSVPGQQPYIGVAIQVPTEDLDGFQRPITQTSYFYFAYVDMASGPVSYTDLYQELSALRLPQEGPVTVSLPRLDPARTAKDITNFGASAVSTTAALLFSGPVTITSPAGSTITERLRFLDAVAALLPYGYRTRYTAATWSGTSAGRQIKLAFSSRPRAEGRAVAWRSAPPAPASDAPGASYLDQLSMLRDRAPGIDRLEELIRDLSAKTEPCDFARPDYAAQCVREFNLPFTVREEIVARTASLADIRLLFTGPRVMELPPAIRRMMLEELIADGNPEDLPVVRKWWDTNVGGDPATMVPALTRACRRHLWSREPDPEACQHYLNLAADHGLLDGVLAGLVSMHDLTKDQTNGLGAAARLVAALVPADPGASLPRTQAAMARSRLLACSLLREVAASEPERKSALAWLTPVLDTFLRPFTAVLDDPPASVQRGQLDSLAPDDANCLGQLLRAASKASRLNLVLPEFAGWLVRAAAGNQAVINRKPEYWRSVASRLAPRDAAERAWLDLALLASCNEPRFILCDGGDRAGYERCFADGWRELTAEHGQAADELLTTALTRYLGLQDWTASNAQADMVIAVLGMLIADGARPRLQAIAAARLNALPPDRLSAAAQRWLDRLEPRIAREGILLMLREPPRDASPQWLAALCDRAFRYKMAPQEVVHALAQAPPGTIRSGANAVAVVEELWRTIPKSDQEERRRWLGSFTMKFADGTLGQAVAPEFQNLMATYTCQEIGQLLNVLYIAATGGRQNGPVTLSEANIEVLTMINGSLDQVLRTARRTRRAQLRTRLAKLGEQVLVPDHDRVLLEVIREGGRAEPVPHRARLCEHCLGRRR